MPALLHRAVNKAVESLKCAIAFSKISYYEIVHNRVAPLYQEIRTECIEEGRQEQAIAMVIRQLTRRLGELSERRVGQIRQLSVPQLEELAESLLDFRQISDLEAWLKDVEKSIV